MQKSLFSEYAGYKKTIFRIMDKNGKILLPKLMPSISDKELLKVYTYMRLSRQYDEWMLKWQRQGRTYGFLAASGQEALQIACAMNLEKGKDWLSPAFRSNAAWMWLGYDIELTMLYWSGNEMGSKMPHGVNILPVCIPIGTQNSHAVGLGYAQKIKKNKSVVLTFIGDGGTSEGEFSEAMNFAGVLKVPVIFVVQNNQWALSTPNNEETSAPNFAIRGEGVGLKNILVDGNDFFAVYLAMKEAVKYAKNNEPVLIECVTYRISDHSTSDDAKVYRSQDIVDKFLPLDPLIRFTNYLIEKKILNKDLIEKIDKENVINLKTSFKNATDRKNNIELEDIFKYTYSKMTPELTRQQKELKRELDKISNSK